MLIIGHARHGKDTLAEFLKKHFDYDSESSSIAALRLFLYDQLKSKYNYNTSSECFEDRVNHRAEWFDSIVEYNKDDLARLAKDILNKSDIYVGMRNNDELQECKRQGIFDLIVGVFNPTKPLEPLESFNIDIWNECDIIIPNAGTLKEFSDRTLKLKALFRPKWFY